ncbi:lipopolysaccharide biosynthesis protein [Pelagibius marinus]|uniref:lipopolysaccharide biosynthesis protein n=1 Tax=Pelagibius marinus TaxID=2762760 RepID=UPI001872C89D|nr:oligosaccharide flippase family protein [Pelagibius marinus]
MLQLFRKLVGTSIFYSLANSIEALSPFFLAILLTRILAPEEYGVWVLFVSLVAFLRPAVNLTIQDALKMHFYELDKAGLAAFVVSAFYLSTASALVLGLIGLLFGETLASFISFPAAWVLAVVFAAYLYVNFYFVLTYNQFAGKRGRFIALQFAQSLLGFAVIAALVFQGAGWQGVILGKVAGLVVTCLLGVAWLAKDLKLSFKLPGRGQFKDMVKFGLVYLPTGFGLVAVPLTDRLIITHLLGLAENGLYGVAALFGAALFVAINGFLHAWMPWLFKRLGELQSNYRREVTAVSLSFLLLLPALGIFFYLVSMLAAPLVVGPSFASSFGLIPWAIAGTVAMGYFYHNQAFLHLRKAILPMSISSLTCILLNAYLSWYGALYYGVAGVLAATIAAFMISAVISGIYIVYHYNIFGSFFAFAQGNTR